MTTPKDPTPAPKAPAPESPAPAPKKPAAKKSAPADSKVSGVKSTATATKPAAKKTAKPATDSSPPAPKTTPKTTTGKNAVAAGAKPVARKPRASAAIPEATRPTANTAAEVIAAPADPIKTAPTNGADKTNLNATKILKRAAKSSKKSGLVAKIEQKAPLYWRLMRMDRPIGTLLLLWPTLWSLWIAAKGVPSLKNLVIFVLGVIVMRAAGCVINDFADRKIDGRVERTKHRPLATGAVSSREALGLFIALCLIAFTLVLFTDPFTIKLSVGGLILAFCYPFMKRHTHLPQLVLGAAFAWGIPMAYAAEAGELPQSIWLIYLAVVLWTVVYDTFYAMVDRDDDLKIGVKSTAILFGEQDRIITGALQVMTIYALILVGNRFELGGFYYVGLAVAAGLFIYQQWLIRFRAREACFKAFLNNNWVGVAVFAGLVLDYSFR